MCLPNQFHSDAENSVERDKYSVNKWFWDSEKKKSTESSIYQEANYDLLTFIIILLLIIIHINKLFKFQKTEQ